MTTNDRSYMTKYAHDHYMKYRWSDSAMELRAARNKARKIMKAKWKKQQVHHIDGNPKNNSKSNLKLVSQLYNERH